MSLAYSAVVGKKEEWASMVTNVAMLNQPFMAWIPLGGKPAQARLDYQAESYKPAARNSHPDAVTVTGATSAGDDRVQLSALIQYATKAASVGKLQQDYGNNAGAGTADELGREIRKQTEELRNDIETALLSPQECRVGISGTTGYLTRGVPNWITASANGVDGGQTVLPVIASQCPPSSNPTTGADPTSVLTVATATVTEDMILNVLQSVGSTTQQNETLTCFCGPNLRRIFNNFPFLTPASATAAITTNGGAYPSPIRGGAFDRGISRYVSPFGFEIDLVTSWRNYNQLATGLPNTTTPTLINHSGLFLHQSKWEFRWGDKPNWMTKPYEGGKTEAFCETIFQLVCWSPRGEAKYAPAT
jgi:hypothetical protein